MPSPPDAYRRDARTTRLFAGLTAFGFLNAVLGPALPYLRAVEHISYVTGALHQVAFAFGGGCAAVLAAGGRGAGARTRIIAGGLGAAALSAIAVAYGAHAPITVAAAFAMSLFGTSALIRTWGALADLHGPHRTVALAEGEVLVSVGSIITPLLVSALAATVLTWRAAIVAGAVGVAGTVVRLRGTELPRPVPPAAAAASRAGASRVHPTLVVVFAIVALEFALSFWLASYLHDDLGLGRAVAALAVSGLYAANLLGRVAASRAARRHPDALILALALLLALIGTPLVLVPRTVGPVLAGTAIAGVGIGAMFPLTSSLHVGATATDSDSSVGQVLLVAALGQLAGPLAAGLLAELGDLRLGLSVLPVLAGLGLAGLAAHQRGVSRPAARPAG